MATLVQKDVVKKYDSSFASGSDKKFPNLDLVRLEKWFFGSNKGRLLEYGFGCGVNLIYLLEQGYRIDAIDSSLEAKKVVESKLQQRPELKENCSLYHLRGDEERIPFSNSIFDNVVCVSVLSLLGSKEAVRTLLSEFLRVMKPGARIIMDINGPRSDFARGCEMIEEDVYLYRGLSGDEDPIRCYCPSDAESFSNLVGEYFFIHDVGYSAHKYFKTEIQEFIVCAEKKGEGI